MFKKVWVVTYTNREGKMIQREFYTEDGADEMEERICARERKDGIRRQFITNVYYKEV